MLDTHEIQLTEPAILSANTYFWTASSTASSRRSNEKRHQTTVQQYLDALGFETERHGDHVRGHRGNVNVDFYYSESCKNVYKSLEVSVESKRSTIRTIRKIHAEVTNTPLAPVNRGKREGGDHYYKAVAIVNERYVSVFDGQTEYVLGETLKQTAQEDHEGGYYVYPTLEAAQNAKFPESSQLLAAPKAILRCEAKGKYIRYASNKLAFSQITPLEVIR